MRIVIMGPPGCGKGTHAAGLATRFGVPAISTGDLFRSLEHEQSELGEEVARIMASGEFVPDRITNDVVADRLAEDDAAVGFVLDGYPRTVQQAEELDETLSSAGLSLDRAIALEVDEDEITRRLSVRAEQEGRSDDSPETIRHRIGVYERETSPIQRLYEQRGILSPIDGSGSVDDVAERIRTSIPSPTAE